MSPGRVRAVIERDMRRFMRNPLPLVASILLPLVFLIILGNAFMGTLKRLPIAVVDLDGGPQAVRVLELLHGIEVGPNTVRPTILSDLSEAKRDVMNGMYKAALVIPPDFSRDVSRGNRPELGLFLDNSDLISSGAIWEITARALAELNPKPMGSGAPVRRDFVPIREDPRIVRLRAVDLYRRIDYDAWLVPGAVVMAIFMGTMITGAFNLVMDRFLGIHESYLATPLTKGDIIAGILVSGITVTTFVALLVLGVGIRLTGIVTIGGIRAFGMLIVVIILSAAALLSLMFTLLGRVDHPRIVGVLGGFLNVIFYFPSGAVYPVESFPNWLAVLSRVNPERYAVHALKSILFKGVRLIEILPDLLFLIFFALIMLGLSLVTFKRTL